MDGSVTFLLTIFANRLIADAAHQISRLDCVSASIYPILTFHSEHETSLVFKTGIFLSRIWVISALLCIFRAEKIAKHLQAFEADFSPVKTHADESFSRVSKVGLFSRR